jgi:DNA adenine methylase
MLGKNQIYLEPFVGAAWIVSEMTATTRWASDTNPYLIALYKALQDGWSPPNEISEELYVKLRKCTGKQKQDGPQVPLDETPDFLGDGYQLALIGFAGCACSFAGIWYGSYARNPKQPGFNFAEKGRNSLLKIRPKIRGVKFRCCSYHEWEPKNALVYCDPPYAATHQPYFSKTFDSDKFWETMRKWSENNIVVVSEYSAPDDFPCIASIPTRTKVDCKTEKDAQRMEKIFSLSKYDPFQGVF